MQIRKQNERVLKQYQQQGSCCVYCSRPVPFEEITRDHFEPVSKGKTFINNKVFSCYKCNQAKANMNIEEFSQKTFTDLCKILNAIAYHQDWKINQEQLDKFKYLTKRFVTVKNIINNGGKPAIIFT